MYFLGPLLLTLVNWLGKDSLMILAGISASAASFLMISNAKTTFEIFLGELFRSLLRITTTCRRNVLFTGRNVVHYAMHFCYFLSTAFFQPAALPCSMAESRLVTDHSYLEWCPRNKQHVYLQVRSHFDIIWLIMIKWNKIEWLFIFILLLLK